MKRQSLAALLAIVLLLSLSACAASDAVRSLDIVEEKVEAKLEEAENKLEESIQNAVAPSSAPAPAAVSEPPAAPAAVSEPPAAPAAPVAEPATAPAVETTPAPVVEPTIAAAPVEKLPTDAMTREQAEKIAMDYLGITPDQVTRLRTEYDIDDGIPQFDIELHQGDWEHEFEIHAENGKILSYEKDSKYD